MYPVFLSFSKILKTKQYCMKAKLTLGMRQARTEIIFCLQGNDSSRNMTISNLEGIERIEESLRNND